MLIVFNQFKTTFSKQRVERKIIDLIVPWIICLISSHQMRLIDVEVRQHTNVYVFFFLHDCIFSNGSACIYTQKKQIVFIQVESLENNLEVHQFISSGTDCQQLYLGSWHTLHQITGFSDKLQLPDFILWESL